VECLEKLFNTIPQRFKLVVVVFDACGRMDADDDVIDVHVEVRAGAAAVRRHPASIYFFHATGFDKEAGAGSSGISYFTEALSAVIDRKHPAGCLVAAIKAVRDSFDAQDIDQMPRRVWSGLEDDDSLGRLKIFDTPDDPPKTSVGTPALPPGAVELVLATPTDATKISAEAMQRCWTALRRAIDARLGKKRDSGLF
jgi:hypothetical protein